MTDKHIIVSGGGGPDPELPWIELYLLAQANKRNPKVCFLGTASGDNGGYIQFFERVFGQFPCETSHLALWHPHTTDIRDFILNQDIIYVGGGNTKCCIGLWREYGLDIILKEAYDLGIILSGGSAGCAVWHREAISDYIPGKLSVLSCLDFLPFSNCPHYGSKERRKAYKEAVSEGSIIGGYGIDDNAAAHFVNGKLLRSISSKPSAKTFEVYMKGSKLQHRRISTQWLGAEKHNSKLIWNSPTFDIQPEPIAEFLKSQKEELPLLKAAE